HGTGRLAALGTRCCPVEDAVAAGEDCDPRMAEARRKAPLPGRQPCGRLPQRTEPAGAAGMPALRRQGSRARIEVGTRQFWNQGANLVQPRVAVAHTLSPGGSIDRLPPSRITNRTVRQPQPAAIRAADVQSSLARPSLCAP